MFVPFLIFWVQDARTRHQTYLQSMHFNGNILDCRIWKVCYFCQQLTSGCPHRFVTPSGYFGNTRSFKKKLAHYSWLLSLHVIVQALGRMMARAARTHGLTGTRNFYCRSGVCVVTQMLFPTVTVAQCQMPPTTSATITFATLPSTTTHPPQAPPPLHVILSGIILYDGGKCRTGVIAVHGLRDRASGKIVIFIGSDSGFNVG